MTAPSYKPEADVVLPLRHSDTTYTLGWANALLTGGVSILVWVLLNRLRAKGVAAPNWPGWYWVPVALVTLGQWFARIVLVVDHDGIRIQECWCWVLPVRTKRLDLAAHAEVYQSWGSDEAEGIQICSRRGAVAVYKTQDSDVIGPAGDAAAKALATRIKAAIAVARAAAGTAP